MTRQDDKQQLSASLWAVFFHPDVNFFCCFSALCKFCMQNEELHRHMVQIKL